MANAGTLTVTLQAVSQKFTAGMNKAAGSLKMFRGAIGPVQAALGGLSAGLLAARFTKVAGDLDMLADSAQSLGVSIKDLSSLQYAGVVKGIANDQLSGALDRLNRATVLAADGNKRYGASFSQLGINTNSFLKLDAEQKLFAVADALQGIDDPARRSAIALRLLGNNSADMMDLLSGGSSGIKDMQKQADALGISVGNSAADLGKFNEELAKLGAQWDGVQRQIVIMFAPGVEAGLEKLGNFMGAANDVGGRNRNSILDGSPVASESGWTGYKQGGFGDNPIYKGVYDYLTSQADQIESGSAVPFYSPKRRSSESAYAKELEDQAKRDAVIAQAGSLWERGKGMLGSAGETAKGLLPGISQAVGMYLGQGGPSTMKGWFKSQSEIDKSKGMAEQQSLLFDHFKSRGMGENNLLKRGTREAWMAERKGAQDKEQINLLKGIEKACAELARRGVTLATLD